MGFGISDKVFTAAMLGTTHLLLVISVLFSLGAYGDEFPPIECQAELNTCFDWGLIEFFKGDDEDKHREIGSVFQQNIPCMQELLSLEKGACSSDTELKRALEYMLLSIPLQCTKTSAEFEEMALCTIEFLPDYCFIMGDNCSYKDELEA